MYEISAKYPHYQMKSLNPFDIFDEFDRKIRFPSISEKLPHPFKTDILDEGDHLVIACEMPGIEKNEIHVDVEDEILSISVDHDENYDSSDYEGKYILKERRCHSSKRSFDISAIDSDKISAKYENGVLKITLPKRMEEAQSAKRIEIE